MKKAMKIFISALVTVLCLSLCACGFVSYVKYDAEDAEDISALREEYLGKLYALSNEEYYRENERREYLRVMLDAENELRECSTAAKLEEVFERHSQIITDIPTDLDLTVSYLSEQLVCSLPTVLYREKEQAMIDNMLSEYLERMQGIANAVEGEKLIYEFKTLVAGIKTDSEYEADRKSTRLNSSH